MKQGFLIAIVFALVLFISSKAHAHPAWGLAVDNQGQVYFSDLTTVWKVDTQGRVSVVRPKDQRHTHDLNVDEAGNVYGADNSYDPATKRFFSAVWRLTPSGEFSYLLPPTEDLPEGTSIFRDRGGNSYHVTSFPEDQLLVLKRSPTGKLSVLIGDSNANRDYRQSVPYSLGGIALASDDALYFVHGANVSKIATDGALIPLARNVTVENDSDGRKAGSPSPLFGIAVNSQGVAFVADYGNRRVLKITSDGQSTTFLRSEPPWFPIGVACLGRDVYILEHSVAPNYAPLNTRVSKLSPDGRATVLATVGETEVAAGSPALSASGSEVSAAKVSRSVLIGAGTIILAAIGIILWRTSKRVYGRTAERE